jgi:plastocyanin
VALMVAVLVATLAQSSTVAAPAHETRANPARLLVTGQEYSLTMSRRAVRSGPAVIQFLNRGQDPHDLRLRRVGRTTGYAAAAPEIRPGELVELDARLRPGRYRLWCSLPDHRRLGMQALLSVERRH